MWHNTPLALSFDIEDWFTVRNMRELFHENDWDKLEYRVHVGVEYLLDQCQKHNVRATFFILGWIAQKSPELIRKIKSMGHEIGSHGFSHTPIDLLTPVTFEADLKKSLDVLEEIIQEKVHGFRAPSFSITKKTSWAIPILKKYGLKYDSSVFVTQHPDYGISDFPEEITHLGDGFFEIPMQKANVFGMRVPVCGGGYFRMLPYFLVKRGLIDSQKTKSPVLYFHPWEFDPDQPQMPLSTLKKFRHYVGLKKNREKFERLLKDFRFCTISELLNNSGAAVQLSQKTYLLE